MFALERRRRRRRRRFFEIPRPNLAQRTRFSESELVGSIFGCEHARGTQSYESCCFMQISQLVSPRNRGHRTSCEGVALFEVDLW